MIGNSVFLAAFQEVGMVDAVFAGKLHAADAHGVFLGDRNLGFHDAEEVAFFCLEYYLIHLVCRTYEYQTVIFHKLGGNNGTFGSAELVTLYQLAHTIFCNAPAEYPLLSLYEAFRYL